MPYRNRVEIKKFGISAFSVIAAAALFWVASGTLKAAYDKSQGNVTVTGNVIGIDNYDGTLTIKPVEGKTGLEGSELTFNIGESTNIKECSQSRALDEIGIGQKVAVSYRELEGRLVADRITIPPVDLSSLTCYIR